MTLSVVFPLIFLVALALVIVSPAPEPVFCTADAKICPDGSAVGRDHTNNCEFFPCPPFEGCSKDAVQCPDGSVVGRDPNNNCAFAPCPGTQGCTEEAKQCPDGSFVERNPANNCEFFPCHTALGCADDGELCPDGSYVYRNSSLDCAFNPCPEVNRCTLIPDAGLCEAAIQRYFFDQSAGECTTFLWGGCGGVVPFQTLAECQQACGGPDVECITDQDCPQIVCVTTPCPSYTCIDSQCVLDL